VSEVTELFQAAFAALVRREMRIIGGKPMRKIEPLDISF
jgi:hypothetical protein